MTFSKDKTAQQEIVELKGALALAQKNMDETYTRYRELQTERQERDRKDADAMRQKAYEDSVSAETTIKRNLAAAIRAWLTPREAVRYQGMGVGVAEVTALAVAVETQLRLGLP